MQHTVGGGWWFNDCFHCNLNGPYICGAVQRGWVGVTWGNFRGEYHSLKYTEMKICFTWLNTQCVPINHMLGCVAYQTLNTHGHLGMTYAYTHNKAHPISASTSTRIDGNHWYATTAMKHADSNGAHHCHGNHNTYFCFNKYIYTHAHTVCIKGHPCLLQCHILLMIL